jgi:hypothetical protein
MKPGLLALGAVALLVLTPMAAHAQGVIGGAQDGAKTGDAAAGPVGAVVGGILGGVTGGIAGLLGVEQRPDFRGYVDSQHHPSDIYRASVVVGNVLPEEGIHYYELPPKYNLSDFRYVIVNDTVVLVNPRTRKIVEVEN